MKSAKPDRVVKIEREIGGRSLVIETGKLARQAHGSAVVRYGENVVLGAVVTGPAREGIDFFPLTVDYREKMSAAGRFPGGFFKREGRPSNKEILTMRMIDRPIRPLFPKSFRDEVMIQVMVLATDRESDCDVIGMVGAGAALAVAPLPFEGPVASVRVARVEGEFIINPTRAQLEYSDIDLVVAGTMNEVNMIEIGSRELSEEDVYSAIKFGHDYGVIPICEMLTSLREQAGKPCKWEAPAEDETTLNKVHGLIYDDLVKARKTAGKQERGDAIDAVKKKVKEKFCPPGAEKPEIPAPQVMAAFEKIDKKFVRERILKEGARPDGRGLKDIRPISCEVGWLPRVHGSALFQRGETQAMVVTTLGTSSDEQIVDEMIEEYAKKFLLHYNFPPFSVGEVRRIMGPGRREIGHGALAERSLEAVLPGPEEFPYTIRLVSDILESNGSSSMASVCGGSLALMDAGVPIKGAVAGISVGLVQDGDKYVIFPDILGEEDGYGDMDFKVAGTRKGITGVQLDIKTRGLKYPILREALELAKKARFHLLDVMDQAIGAPRAEISDHAPRLLTVKVDPEKIGKIIGPGGKTIRAIQADTGAQIDIEDDGTVFISSTDADAAKKAQDIIVRMTEDIIIGRVYEGRVLSIKDFGAFISLNDSQDGLCHISELDDAYVRSVSDVVQIGDAVRVKVIAIDDQGRVKLSRKAAMKESQ